MTHKIGICTGGWDPLHSGHIALFKEAKQLCDYLVVFANSDEWLTRKKGKSFMNIEERLQLLLSVKYIDYVYQIPSDKDTDNTSCHALNVTINAFSQNCEFYFINGGDRVESNTPEKELAEKLGINMLYGIGGTDKLNSSSDIIKKWYDTPVNRNWGTYQVLLDDRTCKVKKLCINVEESISLQYHEKRQEHWTITKGTGLVHLNGNDSIIKEGESVEIPIKAVHKITNIGNDILEIIETQTGTYFGEDDIVRL